MYVLHTRPDTAGLVVHLVLEEIGFPYRVSNPDLHPGTVDTPAYRAIHPMGLVPALETRDGPVFETAAILLWLADRHGGIAPPPGSPDRAAFLKWFFLTSSGLHSTAMQLYYPDRYVADAAGIPGFLAKAGARFHGFLRLIDGMAATEPGWCAPARPSILGYYVMMFLRWAQFYDAQNPGRARPADFPALLRLGRALEARPAARRVAEAEGLGPTIFTNPTV